MIKFDRFATLHGDPYTPEQQEIHSMLKLFLRVSLRFAV
jgi:hypothetical protein